MTEKIKSIVGESLTELDIWVDSAYIEEQEGTKSLCIVLDADFIIPLKKVVMATRIINPLIDKADLIDEAYVLDIYAKEKGDVTNE